MAPLPRLFDTFNADRSKSGNHRVTWFALLELKINKHIKNINMVIIDLNSIDIFLGHD